MILFPQLRDMNLTINCVNTNALTIDFSFVICIKMNDELTIILKKSTRVSFFILINLEVKVIVK